MLGTLSPGQRTRLHRVLGVAFVAIGFVLPSHGFTLFGFDVHPVVTQIFEEVSSE